MGVDLEPQKNYPYEFHQGDALDYLRRHGHRFDAVHASPPCQKFSHATFRRPELNTHEDLVTPTVEALQRYAHLWCVENVFRAPLSRWSIILCGLSFGLKVFRHRRFESNVMLFSPPHTPHGDRRVGKDGYCCVAGHGDVGRKHRERTEAHARRKGAWEAAMGIDWMTRDELAQAIPPAYTKYLGLQLLNALANMPPRPKKR